MSTAFVILAAGRGTRMKSDLPKVLHKVGGAPMLAHALTAAGAADPARVVVVAGHGAEAVTAATLACTREAEVVVQAEQKGTGHAVDQARAILGDFDGDVVVLYGDTPFIRPETLARMAEARAGGADMVVLGFRTADPGRYGRLVTEGARLKRIVEAKDATPEELKIDLCNSGVIRAPARLMFELITGLSDDNASGEFYLTDIVGQATGRGLSAEVVTCDEAETLGVNSRAELARAEKVFQDRARAAALEGGVTLTAPETVFFALDSRVEPDVVIEPHVVMGPGVVLRSGALIRAFSHLEGCEVAGGAEVGPYARLRPEAHIAVGARIGNFVEVKKARVAEGAKVNHLSYVGDAAVGAGANLGAGTITCNYDGVFKHHTEIGAGAFIGSNSALVAPVTVGEGALVGAGSTITRDVAPGALALARGAQEERPGLGKRIMERLRSLKAAKK